LLLLAAVDQVLLELTIRAPLALAQPARPPARRRKARRRGTRKRRAGRASPATTPRTSLRPLLRILRLNARPTRRDPRRRPRLNTVKKPPRTPERRRTTLGVLVLRDKERAAVVDLFALLAARRRGQRALQNF
jgi:hypothetical protein